MAELLDHNRTPRSPARLRGKALVMNEHRIHRIFQIGVLLKGAHALIE